MGHDARSLAVLYANNKDTEQQTVHPHNYAKFRENKILAKQRNHSTIY